MWGWTKSTTGSRSVATVTRVKFSTGMSGQLLVLIWEKKRGANGFPWLQMRWGSVIRTGKAAPPNSTGGGHLEFKCNPQQILFFFYGSQTHHLRERPPAVAVHLWRQVVEAEHVVGAVGQDAGAVGGPATGDGVRQQPAYRDCGLDHFFPKDGGGFTICTLWGNSPGTWRTPSRSRSASGDRG